MKADSWKKVMSAWHVMGVGLYLDVVTKKNKGNLKNDIKRFLLLVTMI